MIRCLTIGTSIVQGELTREETKHAYSSTLLDADFRRPSGFAIIDGKRGKLIPQIRKETKWD